MRRLIKTVFLFGILYLLFIYRTQIIRFMMIHVVYRDSLFSGESNQYVRNQDWLYVQRTDEFYPKTKQDILNLFYTALDSGWEEVTFYCDESYHSCLNDVKSLTDDNYILSSINNFVPTFNSYHRIYVSMNVLGRVNIQFERIYTEEQKKELQAKVDQIYSELITSSMNTEEKIRKIHDYIIDHTVYDQEHAEYVEKNDAFYVTTSNTAYGPLFTGKAVCSGYTDAMTLFLDKMGIPNYKISSYNHIWNFVYIDGEWKHLDLTWDDPVMSNGDNIISYDLFLISTDTLETENIEKHSYDKLIYLEAR